MVAAIDEENSEFSMVEGIKVSKNPFFLLSENDIIHNQVPTRVPTGTDRLNQSTSSSYDTDQGTDRVPIHTDRPETQSTSGSDWVSIHTGENRPGTDSHQLSFDSVELRHDNRPGPTGFRTRYKPIR